MIPVCSHFIRAIISKIVMSDNLLKIIIDAENLRQYITEHSETSINAPTETEIVIATSFESSRRKNGAIIIENQNTKNNDPLDLPADQLKRIVKGIIWRDEHFAGATLKDISKRGGHGENYVNQCVRESFQFLSA